MIDSSWPRSGAEWTELEVLAGDAPSELRVAFGLGDTAGERCAPVVEGHEVVLFLAAVVTDTDATHFVIGSDDNGVMTVDEDQALVHSWVPVGLRESDPPRDDVVHNPRSLTGRRSHRRVPLPVAAGKDTRWMSAPPSQPRAR